MVLVSSNSKTVSSGVIYTIPPLPLQSLKTISKNSISRACTLWPPEGTALLCACPCLWSLRGHKVPRDKRLKAQVGFLRAFTHLAAFWASVYHLYPSHGIIWTAENWAGKSNSEAEWQSTESKALAYKWILFNLAFSFSFFLLLWDYFPNWTSVLGSSASRLFGI